jgi:hypothetical protein
MNGDVTGYGKMRDESGNSYVGTYKDNIRYGYGEFT